MADAVSIEISLSQGLPASYIRRREAHGPPSARRWTPVLRRRVERDVVRLALGEPDEAGRAERDIMRSGRGRRKYVLRDGLRVEVVHAEFVPRKVREPQLVFPGRAGGDLDRLLIWRRRRELLELPERAHAAEFAGGQLGKPQLPVRAGRNA